MSEQFPGRCSICRGDIEYTEAESFVTCPSCGGKQAVALFQREKIRLQQALREKTQAQADLKAAQQEKQAAQEKLNEAISALGGLFDAQQFTQSQLDALSSQLGEDRQAFRSLFVCLRDGQETLTHTACAILKEQISAGKKLQMLQEAAQKMLLEQQGNTQQLESLRASAAALLHGQRRFDGKIDNLQSTADETQKTLNALSDTLKQDKLNKLETLYNQAEDFRFDRAFDKAENAYRKLQVEGAEYAGDPGIYWRMLLSHYGVEHQYSDAAERYVPTIFRPDLTDPAEMSLRRELFACCNAQQKAHYRQALGEIDNVLDEYRRLRAETHYDVFISVKQADNYGHYTADSDKASTLYDQLTGWGLKVFNSRRTIIPAGQEFEPHIIAAMMSAKVMIVVGTKKENMNADWVRNEWTRFQWLQADEKARGGKTERVLFCYLANGMQPQQLPSGLNPNMQAVMEDSSAGEKLRETLKKALSRHFSSQNEVKKAENTVAAPLNQMKIWLEMGKFQQVSAKYNELVDKGEYMDNAYIYLYAMCAAHEKTEIDKLVESEIDLSAEQLCIYAQKFSREQELVEQLLARNLNWREEERIRREKAEKRRREAAERKRKKEEERRRAEEEERRRRAEEERLRREEQERLQREAEEAKRLQEEQERQRIAEEEEKKRLQEEEALRKKREEEYARQQIEKHYEYTDVSDSDVKIIKYRKDYFDKNTVVNVPSHLGGKRVTQIGERAFTECDELTSITLPDTVESIDKWAFAKCTKLTHIGLSGELKSIGERAFMECAALTEISFPEKLNSIGWWAFENCTGLRDITLPASLTSIGACAFEGCTGLEYISLPENVKKIEQYAFSNCTGLKNITIPADISTLSAGLFRGCTGLTNVSLPDGLGYISHSVFYGCTGLGYVRLPDSVWYIGEEAFARCTGLYHVDMPRRVRKIRKSAFKKCPLSLVLRVKRWSYAWIYAKLHLRKTEVY